MTNRADFSAALVESGIPSHMHGAVTRYVMQGLQPGDFLTALLSNDLKGTFARADWQNVHAVNDYLKLFYNYAPSPAWGDEQRVNEWIHVGGWDGLLAAAEQLVDTHD